MFKVFVDELEYGQYDNFDQAKEQASNLAAEGKKNVYILLPEDYNVLPK